MPQVSAHAGKNRDLCLSAHGCLPGTLRYYTTSKWKLWHLKVDLYKDETYNNLHCDQNYMYILQSLGNE